jgi:hypothetical protein
MNRHCAGARRWRRALLGAALLLLVPLAAGNVIHVKWDATGANDGTSWADAHVYLQDALAAAGNGDELWVAAGTYRPDQGSGQLPGDRAASFTLKAGVALYGGFAGTESQRDQRDWTTHVTTLSGDLLANDGPSFANYGDNSRHVVQAPWDSDPGAVLDGFTIRGGNANDGLDGGGLVCYANPLVRNCTFTANRADRYGGAVFCGIDISPAIAECRFEWNFSGQRGGAVYISAEDGAQVSACTFEQNTAGTGGYGGAVFVAGPGGTVLAHCEFLGNHVPQGRGGALAVLNSSALCTDSTFRGNGGPATHYGAAVHVEGGAPRFNDCAFESNSAERMGGAAYVTGALPTFERCTFAFNGSPYGPGALECANGSTVMLLNSILTGNWAGTIGPGALAIETRISSLTTLVNCTVEGNYSIPFQFGGKAIEALGAGASNVLVNCIVWGNRDPGGGVANFAGPVTVSYSDVEGGHAGSGNIAQDPLFVDVHGKNLRLLPGSPCVDAGRNASVPIGVMFDRDGRPRFEDDPQQPDTGVGTPPIVDVGAYEFRYGAGRGDLNCDGLINFFDVDPFLLALLDPAAYPATYPACNYANADCNRDGGVNFFDIDPFLACLFSGCP